MSDIKKIINQNKKLFIPFLMAGYPSLDKSFEGISILAEAGADIIEIGVPFSDPVADGIVNQQAADVALKQGVDLSKIFTKIRKLRENNLGIPIILFSYLNPIIAYGIDSFANDAKNSGVDAVLIVDLPPEEGKNIYSILNKNNIEIVLLTSPTTDPDRLSLYKSYNPCFIYHISRLAVTGMQSNISTNLDEEIKTLRTNLPGTKISVGFGISTPEQAKDIAAIADGVIIGSLVVKTLASESIESFTKLSHELSKAIKN